MFPRYFTRRFVVPALFVPFVGLGFVSLGCSSATPGAVPSASLTAAEVPAERLEDEPAVELPTEPSENLETNDLTVGSGAEAAADDFVMVDYVGRSVGTGEVFDSSWRRRQPTAFALDQALAGWGQGMVGMREGGRRRLVLPPALGWGTQPPEDSPIAVDDTLAFTIDLLRVIRPPDIDVPDQGVSELATTDVVPGTSLSARATSTLTVHYTGVAQSTGEVFDSSWERGEPLTFPFDQAALQGWTEGLLGMKVGGRRELVIPPQLGFGDTGDTERGIPADETLVFVIDLLAVDETPPPIDQAEG